jgi:hypothetical protein
MSDPEVAGIGALLKPNKYSILKFVDLHPGGAAALSGLVCLVQHAYMRRMACGCEGAIRYKAFLDRVRGGCILREGRQHMEGKGCIFPYY